MEIKLVETMEQGLQISIGFALIALLLVTQNVIMAVYASLTIGLIVVNVLAMIPYMGWQLGSSESVGVVVCVGFAVDYVVHLASHYVHSTYYSKHDKTKEFLREMGVSIISGSATTILATAVLFLCVIITFYKFAIFVISTVLFAIFYSLFFFSSLCDLIGPNGQNGNFSIYMTLLAERGKVVLLALQGKVNLPQSHPSGASDGTRSGVRSGRSHHKSTLSEISNISKKDKGRSGNVSKRSSKSGKSRER